MATATNTTAAGSAAYQLDKTDPQALTAAMGAVTDPNNQLMQSPLLRLMGIKEISDKVKTGDPGMDTIAKLVNSKASMELSKILGGGTN